jgi:hypothetical protein
MAKGRGWPLSIIGIFIFLSIMLFGILYISLKFVPVNKENVYQMDYQDVDKGYNELHEADVDFKKHYNVDFIIHKYSKEPVETIRANGEKVYFDHGLTLEGENTFKLKVSEQDKTLDNANISLLLTRYETAEFDKRIKINSIGNGVYESEKFEIKHPGRWKIVAKVAVNDRTGYFERGLFAR